MGTERGLIEGWGGLSYTEFVIGGTDQIGRSIDWIPIIGGGEEGPHYTQI